MPDPDVIVRGDAAAFAQEIVVGRHHLIADEPVEVGGKDMGPSPYDLLLAALGSCTSMTISLYARARKLPLKSVS
ncbi:MAG TPA: OsmC family protein, partial [Chthoniobacterales bacterium]|nr:OsmC family protein [Chthoniobacterales bacterium]